jgi:hypothetical protein
MKKIAFVFIINLLLFSCSKEVYKPTTSYKTIQNTNSDTLHNFSIPAFPASVIHVLHREYVLDNPELELTSELMDEAYVSHMENRLQELYPGEAYTGMLEYTDDILSSVISNLGSYVDSVDAYDVDTIPNFWSEKNDMNLDSTESEDWVAFDALAAKFPEEPATLQEILSLDSTLSHSGKTQLNGCQFAYAYVLSSYATPWAAFRVYQSGERAKSQEKLHYNNINGVDTEGDAYRHIVWNMLMRRYVGNVIAWTTSGVNEICGNNSCSSRQMDFHNNYIGRVTKYELFRDRNNTGNWAWETWCNNAYTWVSNSNNNVDKSLVWRNSSGAEILNCNQIQSNRSTTSQYMYITLVD